jgi:thiosulfate dehydrogenase (quinone) large subunit
MNERFPLAYLVPLRLLFGVIMTWEGFSKLRGDWLHGTPLLRNLDRWLADERPYGFFMPVIRVAHEHPKVFGSLVTMGELAVGLSLLVGLVTRVSAALGALMVLSFAAGAGQGLAPPGNALLMGVVFLLFVAAPPGRVMGLDAILRDRLPRWMV